MSSSAPPSIPIPSAVSVSLPALPHLKKQRTEGYSDGQTHTVVDGRLTTRTSHAPFQYRLRIRNAKQLVVVRSDSSKATEPFNSGEQMGKVEVISNGGVIVGHDGLILAVESDEKLNEEFDEKCSDLLHLYESELDCGSICVLPGLVDGHTHPVWAGDRVHEFAQKLAGVSYMKIHESGGGIGFTVGHTRAASEESLLHSLLCRLSRALRFGTTLLEAKSGYGLEWETELKMLKVLNSAANRHPMELVVNYCAAHSVPKGSTAEEARNDIVNNQIPALQSAIASDLVRVDLIDAFCEKGVFDVSLTKSILLAGQSIGLQANFHGDELNFVGAAEGGAEIGALAISHLEKISPEGIKKMAERRCIATLLPTTAHLLRLEPPPVREMISQGVPVALGSDFNPNAHCISMPQAMFMAAVDFRMTLEECLVAATINSAASLGKSRSHGSIEVGKVADFIILEAPRWEHIIYQWADPPILHVVKKGIPVFNNHSFAEI